VPSTRLAPCRILLLVLVVATPPTANASLPAVEAPRPVAADDIDAVIARGFARLAEQGPLALADELAPLDGTEMLRGQLEPLEAKWESQFPDERRARVELIGTESAGPSTRRIHYLLALPGRPVIWSLTLARLPESGWRIRTFHASDRVEERRDLFRDAAAPGDFAEPIRTAADFATGLAEDDVAALKTLMSHAGSEKEEHDLDRWAAHIGAMRRAIGWRHAHMELADMEPLTPSLIRFVYVEYAPSSQGVWEIIFYRPADRWRTHAVNYQAGNDHTLELLFPRSSGLPQPSPGASPAPQR